MGAFFHAFYLARRQNCTIRKADGMNKTLRRQSLAAGAFQRRLYAKLRGIRTNRGQKNAKRILEPPKAKPLGRIAVVGKYALGMRGKRLLHPALCTVSKALQKFKSGWIRQCCANDLGSVDTSANRFSFCWKHGFTSFSTVSYIIYVGFCQRMRKTNKKAAILLATFLFSCCAV